MRRVYLVLGAAVVVGLIAGLPTANAGQIAPGTTSILDQNGQTTTQPSCDCECDPAVGCATQSKCRTHLESFGHFNCNCRGSYKFPVPPQYTYHWPGMYAQRTITEYQSPYRFPPLNLPPDMLNDAPPPGKASASVQRRAGASNRPQVRPVAYYGWPNGQVRVPAMTLGRPLPPLPGR